MDFGHILRDMFPEHFEALARRDAVMDSLDKPFYSVKEAARILNRRDEDVYAMIAVGELDTIERGKKREKYIAKKELARLLVPVPPGPMEVLMRRSREQSE